MIMLGVGQMNLSVGSLGGLVAVVAGGMMDALGIPAPIAIIAALALGGAAGALNGWLTVRTGINGFIITLATASAFAGINLGLTKAVPFYNLPEGVRRIRQWPDRPIPAAARRAVAGDLCAGAVLSPAPFLADTCSPSAAIRRRRSSPAFSVDRAILLAHVLGPFAAAAGIPAVAQLGSAQPTIGSDWVVISFAAPIIGGASLRAARSRSSARLAVALIGLHPECHGPACRRSLLGDVPPRRVHPCRRLDQPLPRVAPGRGVMLAVDKVSKSFPGVRALHEASLHCSLARSTR